MKGSTKYILPTRKYNLLPWQFFYFHVIKLGVKIICTYMEGKHGGACIGANGYSRGCNRLVLLWRCLLVSLVPFPHKDLRLFLYPSEPFADLLCGLAPTFKFDAEHLKVLVKARHRAPLL